MSIFGGSKSYFEKGQGRCKFLGTNISPYQGSFEDDFPSLKVGDVVGYAFVSKFGPCVLTSWCPRHAKGTAFSWLEITLTCEVMVSPTTVLLKRPIFRGYVAGRVVTTVVFFATVATGILKVKVFIPDKHPHIFFDCGSQELSIVERYPPWKLTVCTWKWRWKYLFPFRMVYFQWLC